MTALAPFGNCAGWPTHRLRILRPSFTWATTTNERGDTTQAVSLYRRMAERPDPFVTAVVRLGSIASERGDRTEAIRQFERAVAIDSTNIEAIVSLGAGYMIEDRFSGAVRLFQRAVRIEPDNQLLAGMLTMAQDRLNSYESEMSAGKMRARIIVVEQRSQADEVLAALRAGGDFVALAQRYSIHPSRDVGGDIWFFGPGEFLPELETAVRNTQVGHYSGIISTSFGYVVLYRIN